MTKSASPAGPWPTVRVVVTVRVGARDWQFRSEPIEPLVAEMLLRQLSDDGRILKARKEAPHPEGA